MIAETESNGGGSFNLKEYYQAVVGRIWLPILGLILGGLLAVFLVSRHENLYHAKSVLFIEDQ